MRYRFFLCNVLLLVRVTCFSSERNSVIEDSIKHLLADFLLTNPSHIFVHQLKDGITNCYNNSDYVVRVGEKKYFAKCGNRYGDLLLTSVANDALCRTIAAAYEIAPAILLYDPQKRILITELIDKKADIDLSDMTTKEKYINLLRRLHASGAQFPNTFCPFQAIKHYIDSALGLAVDFPSVLLQEVLPGIATFSKEKIFLCSAPCHLDPQVSNVLDTQEGMYFIDWECAAMTDPLFDLACVCAIEEFSDQQMLAMLIAYLGSACSKEDITRFYCMRVLADLRYCTYCYLQTALSPSKGELFKTFAEGFLGQILERLRKIKRRS